MQNPGIDEKKVHFIGIGGISMSGLAMILMEKNIPVSGSDRSDSPVLQRLRRQGAEIFIGQKAGQHGDASLVVYTPAIADDDEELTAARASGVPVIRRDELLRRIMTGYRQSIGISGVHGKTTCTSMTAKILIQCGKNPTIHIGGNLPDMNGSVHVGDNNVFVTEACEYKDSFLAFPPTVAVILNIDADHLDYFKDIDHITRSFAKYVSLLPDNGYCIVNGDDARAVNILRGARCGGATFGLSETCDWRAVDIVTGKDACCAFTLTHRGKQLSRVALSVPGRHNVMNALAAIAASAHCGVDADCAAKCLKGFTGAERRFQKIGEAGGATVYHDYAHHPTELLATLEAASELPHRRLWCVFQPHTYTRTKALFDDFVSAFAKADRIVLLDIYAAREPDPGDIHSRMLRDAVNAHFGDGRCAYAASFTEAAELVKAERAPGDLIFAVGAGDVEKLSGMLVE